MNSKFCHNGGSCLFDKKKETFACSIRVSRHGVAKVVNFKHVRNTFTF